MPTIYAVVSCILISRQSRGNLCRVSNLGVPLSSGNRIPDLLLGTSSAPATILARVSALVSLCRMGFLPRQVHQHSRFPPCASCGLWCVPQFRSVVFRPQHSRQGLSHNGNRCSGNPFRGAIYQCQQRGNLPRALSRSSVSQSYQSIS